MSRPRSIDYTDARALRRLGWTYAAIARALGGTPAAAKRACMTPPPPPRELGAILDDLIRVLS